MVAILKLDLNGVKVPNLAKEGVVLKIRYLHLGYAQRGYHRLDLLV